MHPYIPILVKISQIQWTFYMMTYILLCAYPKHDLLNIYQSEQCLRQTSILLYVYHKHRRKCNNSIFAVLCLTLHYMFRP
jgi:hypothetical protein